MQTHQELVDHLVRRGVLKAPSIIEAFRATDRANFIRPQDMAVAYEDYPLSIGFGQTISQPYTVAFMLERLEPQKGDHILDVGSGSGWTTALLARIVQNDGQVLGVERIPQLVTFGQKNLEKYHFSNASIRQAGPQLGIPGEQFDKILVSAAAEEIPSELVRQIKTGGRMVIPVRDSIYAIDRISESQIKEHRYFGFSFVPLKY